jgi:SAM-dependent methyltransferase
MAEEYHAAEQRANVNESPFGDLNNTTETYFQDLGLSWEQLQNKEILDVGAGEAGFARAARLRGIRVTSVDIEQGGMGHEGKIPADVPYIVADFRTGVALPDESFDLIVGRASIHSMVEVQEDMETVIREAKRLLKPGGEFRFGPGSILISPVRQDEWGKWFDLLKKVREGKEITPEEDAWGANVWPQYALETARDKELHGLSHEQRIQKIEEYTLEDLRKIDPTITAHPVTRVLKDWKGEAEHQSQSTYYVMRKETSSQSTSATAK